jgi:hypothetical protein
MSITGIRVSRTPTGGHVSLSESESQDRMLSGVESGTEAAGQRRQGKDNCGGSDINVDRVARNLTDKRDRIFDLYRRRPGVFCQANGRQSRQHDGAQQGEDEPDGVLTQQRKHTDARDIFTIGAIPHIGALMRVFG